MQRFFAFSVVSLLLLMTCGCGGGSGSPASSGKQNWVATTGHIADALQRISAGTGAEIKLLCGPGVDPHSYSASTKDVQAMATADAIFYNGFHLEAKLHDLLHHQFEDRSWSMASAFPETARLDWKEDGKIDPDAPFDPHIWNHLPGWSKCVEGLIAKVCEIDPANADIYKKNGDVYLAEIKTTHEAAAMQFAAIPAERRVIVSAHDAFNYFAKVYDFEPVAVLGIGNDAEADIKTMKEVAEIVSKRKIPVIFMENITNPKVTEALKEACQARDWSVKIASEPLYSDALGSEPPVDTFMGAFQANVDLIVTSLGE